MTYEGQKGAGVGSLFSGLLQDMMPVSKASTIDLNKIEKNKTIKKTKKNLSKEATKAAPNNLNNSEMEKYKFMEKYGRVKNPRLDSKKKTLFTMKNKTPLPPPKRKHQVKKGKPNKKPKKSLLDEDTEDDDY